MYASFGATANDPDQHVRCVRPALYFPARRIVSRALACAESGLQAVAVRTRRRQLDRRCRRGVADHRSIRCPSLIEGALRPAAIDRFLSGRTELDFGDGVGRRQSPRHGQRAGEGGAGGCGQSDGIGTRIL
jgi:hypothetical protein